MNIVKQPTPRNFKTGNVCLSQDEAASIRAGDNLTILKYGSDEVLFTKPITQAMIDTLQDKGEYFLLSYR